MNRVIRTALTKDANPLARLRCAALGGDVSLLALRFESVVMNCTEDRSTLLVAVIDGQVVGYGRAQFHDGHANLYGTTRTLPQGWYLRGVVVDEKFRKAGVASDLTKARLDWLRPKTTSVNCFLDSDEKLTIPMYERFGFSEVSRGWSFLDPQRSTDSGILLRIQFR